MTETRPEAPREIILEARRDGESLETLQRVFSSSKIKIETVSNDPIRIRLPATTRAMEVLLLLLEELRPEGNITLDNGRTYAINDDGLSKLRRLVVRSLSKSDTSNRLVLTPDTVMPKSRSFNAAPIQERIESNEPLPLPSADGRSTSARSGFRSKQVALITVTFLAVVGISIGATTLLALADKISESFVIFILGAAVIGAFSVIHRYASGFKESIS